MLIETACGSSLAATKPHQYQPVLDCALEIPAKGQTLTTLTAIGGTAAGIPDLPSGSVIFNHEGYAHNWAERGRQAMPEIIVNEDLTNLAKILNAGRLSPEDAI